MAGRLQKSTKADKFRFLNIGLEKKYASQIDDLDRKQMLALGQIFRETRKIEIELQQQRNARLTEPIPVHLRGEGRRLGGSTLTNIWRDSASPGADSHLGMRRSASAGDLQGMSPGNIRARGQIPTENLSRHFPNTASSKRKVRFEDDPEKTAKEEPIKQSSVATISPGERTGNVAFSAERIFDSTRALTVYRRLQRKVQESLEHGNNSKNPEAAVESTMKLMKRRQQRKMREEQAEAAKKGGKKFSSSSGPELRAREKVTDSLTKTGCAQGWRTPRREKDGVRSTNKEAYRLPSFTFDDESVHVNRSVASGSNKLEGRKLMERETKLYLGKIQQTAENKRVTRKIDDYFAKY
ncbi:uncharacterized protein LOC105440090 [Strongylocentrotus purpuratus]|uniref:Uncharacterized protein n=1 Tax=Strongylocentrotus purpuratus TaxID=7668 RepID=A0A7M7HLF5_STRPU|nr:uncharacterized protein LOC105440090 [Strongylocentrotus purpuratus]|eukprot:XP_011668152.1 PREDICTED: uncharacterized protein LOC105440090 [Strongylocentrotus purpuratus]